MAALDEAWGIGGAEEARCWLQARRSARLTQHRFRSGAPAAQVPDGRRPLPLAQLDAVPVPNQRVVEVPPLTAVAEHPCQTELPAC